ncbi:YgaP family membrane protein [Desulfoscipio gibsoniae]
MHLDWQRNLSNTDRIIRSIIGLFLVGLVLTKVLTGVWAVLAVIFALSQFIEAFFAY